MNWFEIFKLISGVICLVFYALTMFYMHKTIRLLTDKLYEAQIDIAKLESKRWSVKDINGGTHG